MTSPQDALAEYRMLRQREAILEAQLALGAKQQMTRRGPTQR
jgi:hypothetical protein